MTSKRELKKRLERLEAEQKTDRMAEEGLDGEISEAGVDAMIECSALRLSRASDAVLADAIVSLPADVQEVFGSVNEGATSRNR